MPFHVIVGAGAVAVAAARRLADAGDEVRLVSRRATAPAHERITPVALDATDADALTELSRGAATIFNCAAPEYSSWPKALPPLFRAVLEAAERSSTDYVMLGNLYGYGPADETITEDTPLAATGPKGRVRAQMWQEALKAHAEGRVRATEVRAGQFLGPGVISIFSLTVQANVLAGQLALVPSELDTPGCFTTLDDAAGALVAVAAGGEQSWGRAWHAPITVTTVRDIATRLAALADAPAPRLATMNDRELALLSLISPLWGELEETRYMTHRPFVVDSGRIEAAFGLKPEPLDEALRQLF